MLHFSECMQQRHADTPLKVEKLRRVYQDYFQQPGINKFYAQCVLNYLLLLGQ